jgi:hypothetical protein
MSNDAYNTALNQVQQLSPDEQFQLLEDLAVMLRQRNAHKPQHSILEFEGLGKELWERVNVEDYINEERDSWVKANESMAKGSKRIVASGIKGSVSTTAKEQLIAVARAFDLATKLLQEDLVQEDINLTHQSLEQQTGEIMEGHIRQERNP